MPQNLQRGPIELKQKNKAALQAKFRLPVDPEVVVLGQVGRFVEQKGVDLILKPIPELVHRPVQLVLLGTGQPALEEIARMASKAYPKKVSARIG